MVYKWNKSNRKVFLTTSIGFGYLVSFQRQEGILDLSTGKIDYHYHSLNYLLPNANIDIEINPMKRLGFYIKSTYGRKLNFNNPNISYFVLSTGLILNI